MTPLRQRAQEVFKQCEVAAKCHPDNEAEATACVIEVIHAALEQVVADTWEEAANRAGYASPRIEEMFLEEADKHRQQEAR